MTWKREWGGGCCILANNVYNNITKLKDFILWGREKDFCSTGLKDWEIFWRIGSASLVEGCFSNLYDCKHSEFKL